MTHKQRQLGVKGDAAPAPAACPARTAWTRAAQPGRCFRTRQKPSKANRLSHESKLLKTRGTAALQPQPRALRQWRPWGARVASVSNRIAHGVVRRPTYPLNPLNCVSRAKGGWKHPFLYHWVGSSSCLDSKTLAPRVLQILEVLLFLSLQERLAFDDWRSRIFPPIQGKSVGAQRKWGSCEGLILGAPMVLGASTFQTLKASLHFKCDACSKKLSTLGQSQGFNINKGVSLHEQHLLSHVLCLPRI